MAAIAPDLRPRGPVELYDAALHLCTRGATPLPALSLAGASLPAAAGLWLAYRVAHDHGVWLPSALFALCLMVRGLFAGAASWAAERALEGDCPSSSEALRKVLPRALSLCNASGILVIIHWLLVPATFWLGLAFWSPLLSGLALVARADAGPFSMGGVSRARLGREPTFSVRLLHAVASFLTLVNLYSGIVIALYLARTLFGVDVTYLDRFASVSNPVFDAFLLALTLVVLEPVRIALGVLLLVDARVRSEGLDLQAAVERLEARRKARPTAAALLALCLVSAPVAAQAADRETLDQLSELADELAWSDEERDSLLEGAAGLEDAESLALRRMVRRMRQRAEAGESLDDLSTELRRALAEWNESFAESRDDNPRALAESILARPEFEIPAHKAPGDIDAEPEEEGLLSRFFRWLWEQLQKEEKKPEEPKRCGFGEGPALNLGAGAGLSTALTYVALGVGVALIVILVMRFLVGRKTPAEGADGLVGAASTEVQPHDAFSALARAPEGWWSEADRLAAEGRFREAVRALYLAVLSALHRAGAIDYEPTRSNWDYVRTFRGEAAQRGPFRELTNRFDFVWYGRRGADPANYSRVRALARPILEGGSADA